MSIADDTAPRIRPGSSDGISGTELNSSDNYDARSGSLAPDGRPFAEIPGRWLYAGLAILHFVAESPGMDTQAAERDLRVIRTLMERAALYRRALGPLFILAGAIGTGAGILGEMLMPAEALGFLLYWTTVALLASVASLLLVRKQARQAAEPLWSTPALRVARALLPNFTAGAVFGIVWTLASHFGGGDDLFTPTLVAFSWSLFYGCALCAAGEHVAPSLRRAGWIFVVAGLIALSTLCEFASPTAPGDSSSLLPKLVSLAGAARQVAWSHPHAVMGLVFGGLHLFCGLALWQRERRRSVA